MMKCLIPFLLVIALAPASFAADTVSVDEQLKVTNNSFLSIDDPLSECQLSCTVALVQADNYNDAVAMVSAIICTSAGPFAIPCQVLVVAAWYANAEQNLQDYVQCANSCLQMG